MPVHVIFIQIKLKYKNSESKSPNNNNNNNNNSDLTVHSVATEMICRFTPEETKTGEEISVVSHSFLLDNYEISVRPT